MKPTLEQIKTDESVWPEGATHCINGEFIKWIDDHEYCYSFAGAKWEAERESWPLERYKRGDNKIIPRPTKAFVPEVGTEFEYCNANRDDEYHWCFFVGYDADGDMVVQREDGLKGLQHGHFNLVFRPIKSEREKFVETGIEINKSLGIGETEKSMFEALYDSGKFKLVEQTK